MEVVSVNTCKSGSPSGWWYGDPKHARKCDYLVEHNNGEFCAVYTFDRVSAKNKNGRFSFIGLKKVTDTMISDYIEENFSINDPQKSPQYHEM